jgi:hypothetical protein
VLAVAVLIAAPGATSAGEVHRAFSGNVCSVLSPKRVAIVVSDSKAMSKYKCIPSPSKKTASGTTYSARSGPRTPSQGGLFAVQLVKHSSPMHAGLARSAYVSMGAPVSGIGDWAYERIGPAKVAGRTADLGEIAFGARAYSAVVSVRAAPGKKVNRKALRSLTKTLAKRLR